MQQAVQIVNTQQGCHHIKPGPIKPAVAVVQQVPGFDGQVVKRGARGGGFAVKLDSITKVKDGGQFFSAVSFCSKCLTMAAISAAATA